MCPRECVSPSCQVEAEPLPLQLPRPSPSSPPWTLLKRRRPSRVRVLCNSTMLEERKRRLSTLSTVSSSASDLGCSDDVVEAEATMGVPGKTPVVNIWSNVAFFIESFRLDSDQAAKLMELKNRVSDLDHHDFYSPIWCIRYLHTKHYDVDLTEEMMRKTIAWRVENGVDTILQDWTPPAGILDRYPGAILKGCDREGDPIFVNRTGVTDLAGLVDRYGVEEMLKYEVYRREAVMAGQWVQDWERATGKPVRTSVLIEDLHGLSRHSLASRALKYYGLVTELDGAYYAETNKKIFIIRAPAVFRMAWSVVKRFFDAHIVDKMVFCGEKDYLEVLERHMDLELLPPCIYPGGKGEAVDGHPKSFEGGRV